MNVIPKLGEGTVIEGVKVAFQAFPKPATGDSYTKAESDAIDDAQNVNISANTTAIADTYTKSEIDTWQGDQDTQISDNRNDIATKVDEAPEDGKQYGRKDATWTEVTGGGTLDIDALPALPTELEGTDLFVAERTGTNYKVTADGLSLGTGGGTTDILPVLYSGVINSDGTVKEGTGFTCSQGGDQKYNIVFDTPLPNNKYTVTATATPNVNAGYTPATKTENGFSITLRGITTDGAVANSDFSFLVTGTETIAVGGGGGSYTPEPLVWEDKLADRAVDIVYTNTQDVPLYIQTYVLPSASSQMILELDGVSVGGSGANANVINGQLSTIIPVGSTYAVKITAGTGSIVTWQEARMPVAVGTGSGTTSTWVSFDGFTGDILGSNNVSSITKNGVGDYTLNFTSPLANENYSATCATTEFIHSTNSAVTARIAGDQSTGATLKTVNQFQMVCDAGASPITRYDMALVCVSISSNT